MSDSKDIEAKIAGLAALEKQDKDAGNNSLAEVWRGMRERYEAKRRRQHSHAEAH